MTVQHEGAREAVSFRLGDQRFCIDVLSVREIRGWTPATPLPNAPGYVLGVVNLRGAVLPVIDLGARLGLGPARPAGRHVIIVARQGERLIGLLVDAVNDIVSLAGGVLQPTPDVAGGDAHALIKGVLTLGDDLAGLIDLDHVLPGVAEAA